MVMTLSRRIMNLPYLVGPQLNKAKNQFGSREGVVDLLFVVVVARAAAALTVLVAEERAKESAAARLENTLSMAAIV